MALNSLDIIKGSRPTISIGDWISGGSGGTATYLDIGIVSGFEVDIEKTNKKITADSAFYVFDVFYTGQEIKGKFTVHESDLRRLAKFVGDPDSAVVTGATSLTYNLGEQSSMRYFRLKGVIADQSFAPTPIPATTYTKETIILYRVVFTTKAKLKYVKDDWRHYEVEFEALLDSSAETGAQMGTITDTTT